MKGVYRLLVLDGHISHYSTEFDDYCKTNSILPLYIPLYLSYIL